MLWVPRSCPFDLLLELYMTRSVSFSSWSVLLLGVANPYAFLKLSHADLWIFCSVVLVCVPFCSCWFAHVRSSIVFRSNELNSWTVIGLLGNGCSRIRFGSFQVCFRVR